MGGGSRQGHRYHYCLALVPRGAAFTDRLPNRLGGTPVRLLALDSGLVLHSSSSSRDGAPAAAADAGGAWAVRTPRQWFDAVVGPEAAAGKPSWQAAVQVAAQAPAGAGPGPSSSHIDFTWLTYAEWVRGLGGGNSCAVPGDWDGLAGGSCDLQQQQGRRMQQTAAVPRAQPGKKEARQSLRSKHALQAPKGRREDAAAAAAVIAAGAGCEGHSSDLGDTEADGAVEAAAQQPRAQMQAVPRSSSGGAGGAGGGRGSGACKAPAALHQLQAVAGQSAAAAATVALVQHAAALGGTDAVVVSRGCWAGWPGEA